MRLRLKIGVAWQAGVLMVALLLSGCGMAPTAEEAGSGGVADERPTAAEESPLTVTFAMPATYAPGTSVPVGVSMAYAGEEPVTALALRLVLPEGWQYGGITGALRPAMEPAAGAQGELTFVWIQTPDFPAAFECMADAPAEGGGTVSLEAQALFRRLGGEERSPVAEMALKPGS